MLNLTTAKLLFRCESTSHIFLTNGAVMKRQHNLHPCDNVYFIFTLFPSTVEQNFTCTDSLLSGWLKTLTPFGSALASSTRFSLSVSSIVPYPATSQIVRNERIKWIKRKKKSAYQAGLSSFWQRQPRPPGQAASWGSRSGKHLPEPTKINSKHFVLRINIHMC